MSSPQSSQWIFNASASTDEYIRTLPNLSELKPRSPHAYVSLMFGGDKYLAGCLTLAQSIRSHAKKSAPIDLVCMVTEDVGPEAAEYLGKLFDYVVIVDYMEFSVRQLKTEKQELVYGDFSSKLFTKLQCLRLDMYKKIFFVEADILFVSNCDELFELSAPAGIFSNPWSEKYVPKETSHGFQHHGIRDPYDVRHGKPVPTAMVMDGLVNGGFTCFGTSLLLAPSTAKLNEFTTWLNNKISRESDKAFGYRKCNNTHEEQALAEFFSDPARGTIGNTWTHIHQRFSFIPWKTNWKAQSDKARILHFYGVKPWVLHRAAYNDLTVWWHYADIARGILGHGADKYFIPRARHTSKIGPK